MSQSTKLSVKQLQTLLNDLPFDMEDRSVTEGDDFYRLYTKFFNVIEHTDYKVDIVDGLDNAVAAFQGLLDGKNFGKLVVRVRDDPTVK